MLSEKKENVLTTAQKIKFSIKDFFTAQKTGNHRFGHIY